jgi:hypothetical protein
MPQLTVRTNRLVSLSSTTRTRKAAQLRRSQGRSRRRELRQRHTHPEGAARTWLAVHTHIAAHGRHQTPADRQPEAGPAEPAGGRRVGLRERLEQPLLICGTDPDPGVADESSIIGTSSCSTRPARTPPHLPR